MNEGREVSSLFPKKRKEPPTSAEDSSAFHDHPYVSMNSSSIQKQNLKNAEGTDDDDEEEEEEEEEEKDSDVDGEGDDDRSSEAGKNGANFHELQGRHIIEINFLVKELMKGCHYCCKPLNLSACIGDSRYGLGSLLHIKCENCKKVSLVPTGKRHGPNAWDVNSKLGAAMLFCGIGETAINALLAALNLPSVTPTTLKRREREAGVAFEAVADATCQNAILNEKNSCEVTDSEEAVSFDAGWQTRGSGRNYASLSGHGSMIGVNTGKVLAYSFRSKKCRFCDRAKEGDIKEHDCRKNWDKSSKAMESDMAIEMLQDMKNKGFHVKKLIMDNDSTTISRAKLTFDEDLEKHSDFNHTKKNFTNKLFELRKEKKYAALGPKTIKHLTKCFAYAVKSATDKTSLTTNLSAIPLHVFGNHSQCGDWCGSLKQPESYKPRNLPYGKYLTGEGLLQDLQKVFQTFSNNVDKLLKIGSTQANESFNHMVACKNPKSRFYAGSESTAFRVAVAVAQKNIGQETLSKVYDNSLLSPGKNTIKYNTKVEKNENTTKPVKKPLHIRNVDRN